MLCYCVEFWSSILKEVQVKLQRPYSVYHDYQECVIPKKSNKTDTIGKETDGRNSCNSAGKIEIK